MAVVFSAWWPGGRAATKTLSARPGKTSSTAALAAPIAVTAACQLFGLSAGVGVDRDDAGLGYRRADARDEILRVGIEDGCLVAFRRLDAVERGKGLVVEHALDGAQAVGPLGMAGRRHVFEKDRVGVEPCDHAPI